MKKHLLGLALLFVMMPQILSAQTIELVKDIDTTGDYGNLYMHERAATGNLLFYVAFDVFHKTQLWRSDGTVEGTFRLTDILKGWDAKPTGLTAVNGVAFWRFTYNHEQWLFRSDGTIAGTYPLHKIPLGLPDTNGIAEVNGTIYFPGSGPDSSRQLWKTDGTIAGTVLVREISANVPGATGAFDLFSFNGMLYFLSGINNDGNESYQLWKSDGTAAGTLPGPAFAGRFRPVALNDYMYFSENNVLKKTDGTTITTVKNFQVLHELVVKGQAIYFFAWGNSAGMELWRSDGTAARTVPVKDIQKTDYDSYNPPHLVNVNGTLYFTFEEKYDGSYTLWKSNGTAAGTVLVEKLGATGYTYVEELIAVGNQAVFSVFTYDGTSVNGKIWKSDGTRAGTQLISNVRGFQLTGAGETLYFNGGNSSGIELHKSDLTLAGTMPFPLVNGPGSWPRQIFECNGIGYFVTVMGDGVTGLWKTDNTTAGTVLLKEFPFVPGSGESELNHFTNVDGTLYLVLNDKEIWKSDGTTDGTVLVKNFTFLSFNYGRNISGLTGLNGTLYFGVLDVTTFWSPVQLWKSDGTEAGTVPVITFDNTARLNPVVLKGQLYFFAWDGINSEELWKSDGTPEGTSQVSDIAGHDEQIREPLVFDNHIYYIMTNFRNYDKLLVKSDGTAAGTRVIKSMLPGEFIYVSDLFKAGNLVYFSMIEAETFREQLWRTDGTEEGTIKLAGFDAYYDDYRFLRQKTEAGGKFFFVPYDEEIGDQLWVSDGTPSGTRMVKNIGRLANDFTIDHLAAIGDIVYFTPHDPATGTELWQSDGTSEGTYLVYDQTTNGSTAFYELANVNGTLLISQGLDTTGAELYKYQPAQASQLVANPLADAYVRNTPYGNNNYGLATTLEVKAGSLPAYQRGSYLKFPLNGISQVVSAKLRLYGSNVQTSANTSVAAYAVSDDSWTEMGITWSNAPAGSGSALGSVNVHSTVRYYEIDVTDFVKSELAGDKMVSLFVTNPAGQNNRLIFNSRENAESRPQLVIETAALPAARTGAGEIVTLTEKEPEVSGIYPNPTGKRFTVHISKAHQGKVDLQLINLSGNTYQISHQKTAAPASKLEMDISSMQLSKGIYILKIQSQTLTEKVRMVLTE